MSPRALPVPTSLRTASCPLLKTWSLVASTSPCAYPRSQTQTMKSTQWVDLMKKIRCSAHVKSSTWRQGSGTKSQIWSRKGSTGRWLSVAVSTCMSLEEWIKKTSYWAQLKDTTPGWMSGALWKLASNSLWATYLPSALTLSISSS
jgi:hypothetical protein